MTATHPDWDLPAVPTSGAAPTAVKLTETQAEAQRELAQWVREQKLPETPDEDLVKFLHSCDYDLDKAKLCAKDFYWSRTQVPEYFTGWDTDLPNIRAILDVMSVVIVPRRTPENYRIVITALKTSDTTNYIVPDVCKTMLMAMESIFLTEPTIDGLIVIHDIAMATFTHFIKAAWYTPRKMQPYFQAGLPLKRQSIHLVNCSKFVDSALKLMKNFGRQEDWDRLRVHRGDDFVELHKIIPPECLPSDFGGTLPSMAELQEITIQRFSDFKHIFEKQGS